VLDELGMTIVDARIMPIDDGYSLDTFIFMELDKQNEIDDVRLEKIRRALTQVLGVSEDNITKVTRTTPRQVRVFKTATRVEFSDDPANDLTVMELVASDRPGLLSKVGQTFLAQEIDITAAKIMTIGERAEDVFYICRRDGSPLDDAAKESLREKITTKLEP
jgi:[protein-PII] uridylyltransferase